MTGLFIKKYHVAVLDNNNEFVSTIVNSLKSWYNDKIVVETYKNAHDMFEAVNINEIRNNPFDLAVLTPAQYAEKMVLKQSNPDLKVILCKDPQALKFETVKALL
jgi:hypothetical protein